MSYSVYTMDNIYTEIQEDVTIEEFGIDTLGKIYILLGKENQQVKSYHIKIIDSKTLKILHVIKPESNEMIG